MSNVLDPQLLAFLALATDKILGIVEGIIKEAPYGFIYDTCEKVIVGDVEGRLVWDYVVWNELTFEEKNTGKKRSLYSSISDKETRKRFDAFVERYGVK